MTTDAPDFTFHEPTHTYKVGQTIYPSVTQIIREAGMMPWLDYMERQQPEVLASAQERGTRVHEVVALINQGKDWVRSQAFNELDYFGESGYINAYLEWLSDSKFQVNTASVEQRFINRKLRYAGTIDFFGFEKDTELGATIVDVKSGGLEPAGRLQTAAYQNHRETMIHKDLLGRRMILCLKRDGTYRAHPLSVSENSADWNAFLSCLNCFNFKQRHSLIQQERKAA